jgi:flagellar motility protein MotE (MotC chaperone)
VKKILNVIVLTLALNFLAVLAGTGVVLSKAHMDRDKFTKVKEVLFDTTQPAVVDLSTTQPVATTEPADHLAELLAKVSGRPAGEQVDFIRQTYDGEKAELDRKHRELEDLQHQIDLARDQTRLDRQKLENAQKDLDDRQKLQDKLASDKGFQDSLELYNVMPAKQVKTIFMTLADDTVQQYLQAMEPRTAAKIIKEFKLPEETARIQKVLEKIRQSQAANASGTPVAPAGSGQTPAGLPQAAVPTQ